MEFNLENYEEHALDYLEGSLSPPDREAFQTFLLLHPQIKDELEGFEIIEVQPDLGEELTSKDQLYRSRRISPMFFAGLGAVLLLLAILVGSKVLDDGHSGETLASIDQEQNHTSDNIELDHRPVEVLSDDLVERPTPVQETQKDPTVATETEVPSKVEQPIKPMRQQEHIYTAAPMERSKVEERQMEEMEPRLQVLKRTDLPSRSFRGLEQIVDEIDQVIPQLEVTPRDIKIEVIHESLIEQYSKILDDSVGKGKFSQWIAQANFVPRAFKDDNSANWKERLLPDYITAE